MSLNPVTLFEKAINEHGSAVILKERVELFRDALQLLQDTKAQLERDKEALLQQVEHLQKQAERQQKECDQLREELEALRGQQSDYVKHRGALFRVEGGVVEREAYCPKCESPMSSLQGMLPFRCHCGYSIALTGFDLPGVIQEVEAKATKA